MIVGGNSFYCFLGNDVALSPTSGQMGTIPPGRGEGPTHYWRAVLVMLVMVVLVMIDGRLSGFGSSGEFIYFLLGGFNPVHHVKPLPLAYGCLLCLL